MSENILWNNTEKKVGRVRIGTKPRGEGCPGNQGGIGPSWLAYPLYLMANECQRLSCFHPVKLRGWWQVQVGRLLRGGGHLTEKDRQEPGWQMRSLSHEDGTDELCSHFPARKLQKALTCQTLNKSP